MAAVGASFQCVKNLRNIHGFEVGLLKPALCKALHSLITDDEGNVRGYTTYRGNVPVLNLRMILLMRYFRQQLKVVGYSLT